MLSGTNNYLLYEIYKPLNATADAACSFSSAVVWGAAGANQLSPTASLSTNSRNYNVCGSVPAGQDPAIGNYSDTVVVTVTF